MRLGVLLFASLLAGVLHAQSPTVNPAPAWVLTAAGPGHAAVTGLTTAWGGVDIVATGTFEDSLAFGAAAPLVAPTGSPAAFLVTVQQGVGGSGAALWHRRIACAAGCAMGSPRVAASRDVYEPLRIVVAGWADGPVTLDGGAAPHVTLGHDGGADGFVALYDASGTLLWAERLGGTGDARPANVRAGVRPGGAPVVWVSGAFSGDVTWAAETGPGGDTSAGGTDGFVVAYTLTGERELAMRFGGAQDDAAADAAGWPWVAATFRDTLVVGTDTLVSRGGTDAAALQLSDTFEVVQAIHAGGPGDDAARALSGGGGWYDNPLLMTGTFAATLTVGDLSLESLGGTDGFLLWLPDDWDPSISLSGFGSTADDEVSDAAMAVDWYGDIGAARPVVVGTTLGRLQVSMWSGPAQLPSYGGADGFAFGRNQFQDETGAQVGGTGEDHVLAVASGPYYSWSAVTGGSFQQSARFGHLTISGHGAGDDDAFIAYYPEGTLTHFYASDEPAPAPASALRVAPNPARAGATVRLAVEAPSDRVTVRVHDALGRIAAVLHDGPLGAGETAFALPASLPAGRYLVRATGGATASVPVTVMR